MSVSAANTYAAFVQRPLNQWQWAGVGACVALQVVDGFDILVTATAAATIKADLNLSTPTLGLILSASLLGMMLGAVFLAPVADRWGRKPTLLFCLTLSTAGMLLAGSAQGADQLIACRLLTGLGVGGIMPVLNTACAELSGGARRNLIITIHAAGYPLGGLVAAIFGSAWLGAHSWRSLMQLASIPAFSAMLLVGTFLPESVPFLLARRPRNALERANKVLARFGMGVLAELPPEVAELRKRGWRMLFEGREFSGLTIFALATFLTQFSFYFFVSWLPTVIEPHLSDISIRSVGSIALNLGGILGDFAFGVLCLWAAARRLTLGALVLSALGVWLLAAAMGQPAATVLLALFIGGGLFAAMAGIYATAPTVFPALTRSSGTGIAFGLGRFGGALSPYLGALALNAPELTLASALVLMTLPLVAAVLLIKSLSRFELAID